MASQSEIIRQLSKFAIVYQRQVTSEEFAVLVDVWHDIFAEIPEHLFIKYCNLYTKGNTKFPVPAQILDGCEYEIGVELMELASLKELPQ